MKKLIYILAGISMLAVSCQKETPATDNTGSSSTTGKLTATFVKTKVSYAETTELNLQPAWEVGDKIIGFDDAGNTYTLAVASVAAETATLSGTVPDGALHLIYKSGAQADDINNKTLAVDYTAQKGDKTMPAVMLADGTVENGSCEFAFSNAGAIIGISAVNGVPSGSAISKITVEGSNLSAATVALSGSALALTATPAATDAISTAALSGITTTDAKGTLSKPVFIAVPAGANIKKVSVGLQARVPETMTIPSTADDKKNIDYVEIEAKYDGTNLSTKKWAKWNVGANSPSDYGWYFDWAGTEGHVWYADTWQSAKATSVEFSYTISSAKTTGASDYLYVKAQTFSVVGQSFGWVNTPYQTQNTVYMNSTRFTKYLGSTSSPYKDASATDEDALKTVLDPEDDAAYVNWGGTWRMPTLAEFRAMRDATYWAWDATDKGYYVFKADATTHAAGSRGSSIPDDLSKDNALLFFPAAGYGNNARLNETGSDGFYWTSSLYTSDPYLAHFLSFSMFFDNPNSETTRYIYQPVRPVSD